MAAYSFQPQFHEPILVGDKTFTMRAAGKRHHAKLGGPITGTEGRAKPTFFASTCCFRAEVALSAQGVLRVLYPVAEGEEGQALMRLFMAAEQGSPQAAEHAAQIAQRDGFTDWPALWAFHSADLSPRETVVARQVIGWVPPLKVL